MSGRADRGTQDQAIAAETRHRLTVDRQVQVDDVERRAGLNGDLVETKKRPASLRAVYLAFEHQVLGDAVFALKHLGKASA